MPGTSDVIHNQTVIAHNLSLLAKNRCMITAFLGGKDTFLTVIIDVNLKTGEVLFDTSASEKLNIKLLSKLVRFNTVFNGTQVAFTGESIKRIKYKGYDVFIMPTPLSLYWHDRRGAYRVNAFSTHEAGICNITLSPPNENTASEYQVDYKKITENLKFQLREQMENIAVQPSEIELDNLSNVLSFKLFDISITGCSVINDKEYFSCVLTPNTIYQNCLIVMPDHGEAIVSLEVMINRKMEFEELNGSFKEFVGFKFIDTTLSDESKIFRYIQALDRLAKKKDNSDFR